MKAFVYQAALLCEACAKETRNKLRAEGCAPVNEDDERSCDSDDYPKGPYDNGGGEADSPQHCDFCGVFLRNPLTDDGRKYVIEATEAAKCSPAVVKEWIKFYDLWPYTEEGSRIRWRFLP